MYRRTTAFGLPVVSPVTVPRPSVAPNVGSVTHAPALQVPGVWSEVYSEASMPSGSNDLSAASSEPSPRRAVLLRCQSVNVSKTQSGIRS